MTGRISLALKTNNRKVRRIRYLVCGLVVGAACLGAAQAPKNLALSGLRARAKSWEPGVHVIPEHEPAKAIDGSLHTYWAVQAADLPADLGVEWPQPQQISSLIVRYFDGKMVRGPAVARTQQWARLQYWSQGEWRSVSAQIFGQETSSVRYVFSPITTTRLRLLFTEPPDPQARRSPERLGIFVCEFEAYRDVPFQWVSSPGRLVKISDRRDFQNYNEAPGDDSAYDLSGPLVIEPKQTRVFTDTLTPTLIVSESRWAREACVVERTQQQLIRLRNGFVQLEISAAGGLKETRLTNRVTGETVATPRSKAFVLRTSEAELTSADFKLVSVDTSGSDDQTGRLRVELSSGKVDVAVHYELRRRDHFYHKDLTLTNKGSSDLQIRDVIVSWLELPRLVDLMAGGQLTYPVSHVVKGGFFECLETVYWDHDGDALTYYPGTNLAPGKSLESEKAVVGVYENRNELVAGWDRGVREWVTEYHTQVSPVPKEWPDVYCEGWSAKIGVKELLERPEWTERFMATAERMGIRYMDTWEPTHQALLMPTEWINRWVELANRHNIGSGWWNDFGSDDDWGWGPPMKPQACKLSPEAEEFFRKIVDLVRTYKLRALHWADFFAVWPCDKTEHGHLPGKYSIYAQGQRMIRFAREMHEASSGLMLGADGGLNSPQYGRYADSRHHGGGVDAYASVEPDIHLDRLYADMNRAYLYVLAHSTFLRPWYRLLNCVNHFGQETHLHDRAGYRYALLSALALAGQLTFNDAPDNIPASEIRFTQRWLSWGKTNKGYLKQTDRLFDRSLHFADIEQGDAESLAGFAHIRGDRGFIFLLNPGVVEQVAELTLALDAPPSEKFIVQEVYPGGMTLQGPANGAYQQSGKLRVTVPGKQARILWIAPSSAISEKRNGTPEDARTPEARRYVGDWTILARTPEFTTLRARFEFPSSGQSYLSQAVPESQWAKEPWAYDKAYLVLLLKDETEPLVQNWVPDNLAVAGSLSSLAAPKPASVLINGVPKTLHPFKTSHNQQEGLTRCYFADLEEETKAGQSNEVELTLPIRTGLVFSGAYLDLPDQMPFGIEVDE